MFAATVRQKIFYFENGITKIPRNVNSFILIDAHHISEDFYLRAQKTFNFILNYTRASKAEWKLRNI